MLVCIRVEIVSSLSVKRGLGNTSLFLSPVNRVCAGNVVRVAFSFPSPLAQSCTENEEHHGYERGQEQCGNSLLCLLPFLAAGLGRVQQC